jgi:hypothetical protein
MGTDDLHKRKQTSRSNRKTKKERVNILIACEDEKSSKYYLNGLIKFLDLGGKVITLPKSKGTEPLQVLNHLIEKSEKYKYLDRWIVIDRDQHSTFSQALIESKKQNIKVAYSNEAFELWLILHFKDLQRYTNRKDLEKILDDEIIKNNISKSGYSKSDDEIFQKVYSRQNDAIKRAKNLINIFQNNNGEINPTKNNPSTNFYQLIEELKNITK